MAEKASIIHGGQTVQSRRSSAARQAAIATPWPEGMRPRRVVDGRMTMRTAFPQSVPVASVLLRPSYFPTWPAERLEPLVQHFFPGLRPRSVFRDSTSDIYGFTFAQYVTHLYNLEGLIAAGEQIEGDMIAAGMLLTLQDLTHIAWFPKSTHWQMTIRYDVGRVAVENSKSRRFLVVPVFLPRATTSSNSHWALAIVDKEKKLIFWFNSLPSIQVNSMKRTFKAWLVAHGLVTPNDPYTNQDVEITEQCNNWECGLIVLECVRCFFREPSIGSATGPADWARSRQYARAIPVLGTLDTTEKKLAWMRMCWRGWIRAELGHSDFSNIRYPAEPTGTIDDERVIDVSYGDILTPNGLPEKYVGTEDDLLAAVAAVGGEAVPQEPEHIGPVIKKVAPVELTVAFNTWVSGEAGVFFSEYMPPQTRVYSYQRFRTAPDMPPPKYTNGMPVPAPPVDDESVREEDYEGYQSEETDQDDHDEIDLTALRIELDRSRTTKEDNVANAAAEQILLVDPPAAQLSETKSKAPPTRKRSAPDGGTTASPQKKHKKNKMHKEGAGQRKREVENTATMGTGGGDQRTGYRQAHLRPLSLPGYTPGADSGRRMARVAS